MARQTVFLDLSSEVSTASHSTLFQFAFSFTYSIRFFPGYSIPSFERELGAHGFHCISSGKEKGGWYHKFFRRNQLHLCSQICSLSVEHIQTDAIHPHVCCPSSMLGSQYSATLSYMPPAIDDEPNITVVNALLPNPFPSNLPARNAGYKHPKVDNAFILPNVSRLHEFLHEAPNLNQSRHQSWSTISSQSSI